MHYSLIHIVVLFCCWAFPWQCCAKSLLFFFDAKIPGYLRHTFEQARLFHPLPLQIRFLTTQNSFTDCFWCESVLTALSIDVEFTAEEISVPLQRLSQVIPFESGAGLFGFTRFFHIEAMIARLALTDVIQIECDNLLYMNVLDLIVPQSRNRRRFGQLAATPCGKGFATASVFYIRNAAALRHLNEYAIAWCRLSREQIVALMPADSGLADTQDWGSIHSEMHFLGYYHRVFGQAFLSHLPVLPFGKFGPPLAGVVFDPGSYGQLVGSNWAGDHHVVGRELIHNGLAVRWRRAEPQPVANSTEVHYAPFVRDLVGNEWPIANLHIFSKSLAPWRSSGVAHAVGSTIVVNNRTIQTIGDHGRNYKYD